MKLLLDPVPPVPLKQLTMLLVLHTKIGIGNKDPLTDRPNASTFSRSVVPAARITVSLSPADPITPPMIVLFDPVVTAHPAFRPKKLLLDPVVFEQPALSPMKLLYDPVVL